MVTDPHTCTRVHEIADGIYRISTPVPLPGGQAFSFNQYLVVDDEPLLFHTGPRQLFAAVRDAMAAVMPVERLRYVGLSHVEADECGSMNLWLQAAPAAVPLCGSLAAMVSMNDLADRAPRALADGETLRLGRHELQWFDTPHVPHGWECGLAMERTTRTFLCGDTRSLTHAMIDSPVVARDSGSGFTTTNAFGISPASSSGRRTTATSRTAGCVNSSASSSAGATCIPLYLISSFVRSTM